MIASVIQDGARGHVASNTNRHVLRNRQFSQAEVFKFIFNEIVLIPDIYPRNQFYFPTKNTWLLLNSAKLATATF